MSTQQTKTKQIQLFIATFVFACLFFFGILAGAKTFIPGFSAILSSFHAPAKELPLSRDRLVPFATPAPEIIVRPYPVLQAMVPPATPQEARQNWIRIPKIGVAVPLVQSATMNDTDVIATLQNGAALYPNGIVPGAIGNTFVSAHSSGNPWQGPYRFAFTKINELTPGDVIHIDWHGARYTYRIRNSETIVPTKDFRVISDRPVPTLSIMACWPIWSTSHRMLVHAELTNITQLTKPIAI